MEGCRGSYCDPLDLHLAMVNYAVRKHMSGRARGEPAVKIHFTPTHAPWMNLVEVWSGIVERRAIRRQAFRSFKDLNFKVRAVRRRLERPLPPLRLDQDRRRDPHEGRSFNDFVRATRASPRSSTLGGAASTLGPCRSGTTP